MKKQFYARLFRSSFRLSKKLFIALFTVILIIVGTSCSQHNNSVYVISPEETKLHFEKYENDLKDYGETDAKWHDREGKIFIYPDNSEAFVTFELYNQVPDRLYPFSKETDNGYERYRITSDKILVSENEVYNFEGAYGKTLSVLLSRVTGKCITAELIEESFDKAGIYKISLYSDKIDFSVLQEQVLFDEEIYIENVRCNYNLSYYSSPNKFVEQICFGGMEHNNYVNLQTYSQESNYGKNQTSGNKH